MDEGDHHRRYFEKKEEKTSTLKVSPTVCDIFGLSIYDLKSNPNTIIEHMPRQWSRDKSTLVKGQFNMDTRVELFSDSINPNKEEPVLQSGEYNISETYSAQKLLTLGKEIYDFVGAVSLDIFLGWGVSLMELQNQSDWESIPLNIKEDFVKALNSKVWDFVYLIAKSNGYIKLLDRFDHELHTQFFIFQDTWRSPFASILKLKGLHPLFYKPIQFVEGVMSNDYEETFLAPIFEKWMVSEVLSIYDSREKGTYMDVGSTYHSGESVSENFFDWSNFRDKYPDFFRNQVALLRTGNSDQAKLYQSLPFDYFEEVENGETETRDRWMEKNKEYQTFRDNMISSLQNYIEARERYSDGNKSEKPRNSKLEQEIFNIQKRINKLRGILKKLPDEIIPIRRNVQSATAFSKLPKENEVEGANAHQSLENSYKSKSGQEAILELELYKLEKKLEKLKKLLPNQLETSKYTGPLKDFVLFLEKHSVDLFFSRNAEELYSDYEKARTFYSWGGDAILWDDLYYWIDENELEEMFDKVPTKMLKEFLERLSKATDIFGRSEDDRIIRLQAQMALLRSVAPTVNLRYGRKGQIYLTHEEEKARYQELTKQNHNPLTTFEGSSRFTSSEIAGKTLPVARVSPQVNLITDVQQWDNQAGDFISFEPSGLLHQEHSESLLEFRHADCTVQMWIGPETKSIPIPGKKEGVKFVGFTAGNQLSVQESFTIQGGTYRLTIVEPPSNPTPVTFFYVEATKAKSRHQRLYELLNTDVHELPWFKSDQTDQNLTIHPSFIGTKKESLDRQRKPLKSEEINLETFIDQNNPKEQCLFVGLKHLKTLRTQKKVKELQLLNELKTLFSSLNIQYAFTNQDYRGDTYDERIKKRIYEALKSENTAGAICQDMVDIIAFACRYLNIEATIINGFQSGFQQGADIVSSADAHTSLMLIIDGKKVAFDPTSLTKPGPGNVVLDEAQKKLNPADFNTFDLQAYRQDQIIRRQASEEIVAVGTPERIVESISEEQKVSNRIERYLTRFSRDPDLFYKFHYLVWKLIHTTVSYGKRQVEYQKVVDNYNEEDMKEYYSRVRDESPAEMMKANRNHYRYILGALQGFMYVDSSSTYSKEYDENFTNYIQRIDEKTKEFVLDKIDELYVQTSK